jgi:ABC-type amino acid transport substrate-binding protein
MKSFLHRLLIPCFFFLCLALPGAASAANATFRVATEGAYPPFNSLDEKGQPIGYDVDIAHALGRAMGVDVLVTAAPWEQLIPGLLEGKYDAIIAQMGKTPEREKLVAFTDKYLSTRQSFVGKKGLAANASKDFKGKRLGTQKGTILADYLQKTYGKSATLTLYDDMDRAYQALIDGSVDLLVADSFNIFEFLKSPKGQDFDFVGEALPADELSNNSFIAVRKNDTQLRDAINKALHDIQLDGSYAKINRKHFPFLTY